MCGCTAAVKGTADPEPIHAEDVTALPLTEDDYEIRVLTELGITESVIDLSGELTRAEALDMIDRLIPHDVYLVDFDVTPYDDIAGHWAEGIIKHYYNTGALAEIAEGSFEPDRATSAREFTTVLLRAMGYEYARPDIACEEGIETGLLSSEYTKAIVKNDLPLTRSDACRLAYAAFTALTSEWKPLYRLLIEQGYYGEELADMIVGCGDGGSFADRLNGALPKDKNYMFSPLSIKIALAMAANGAEGELSRRQQILDLIGVNNLDAYNVFVRDTIESYKTGAVTLNIANSVWLNEDNTPYKFSDPFRTVIEKNYFGEVRTVNNKNAVSEINAWSSEKTNGKIPTIINNPDFAVALINAVYFNGAWRCDFDEASTKKAGFTQADGSVKEADFMNQTGYFSYWDTAGARIVELPYKDTAEETDEETGEYISYQRYRYMDLGLYILLPKTEGLDISAELSRVTENYDSAYLDLSVPKFKFKSEFALKDILKSLGMEMTYTDGDSPLGLDLLHKTYIDVNEKGTEAAAETALLVTGCAPPPEPIEFRADRPFSFAVRDNTTGEIIFMGEYMYVE